MTKDLPVEDQMEDTQPKPQQEQKQKRPFQVVLVDIEKAAKDNVIHCVKIPLEQNELKFVALSYRWGELHETLVDTKVGYTASITSFAIKDFYQLCRMMTLESDLKHIKYVWVDAICVDQQHAARRKATIYQMSNIYDRATYILAVPDLHMTYLKGVSIKNHDAIVSSDEYGKYMYHLIHGNKSQLDALDEDFLNHIQVPEDPPELRPLLLNYTDYFANAFMEWHLHDPSYCPVRALDHLCNTSISKHHKSWKTWIKIKGYYCGDLHQCYEVDCPLALFNYNAPIGTWKESSQLPESEWKSKIPERSDSIQQSMEFLMDLIKDWSTRVWVISEINIAKKDKKLKYWFLQLAHHRNDIASDDDIKGGFTFFKFDPDNIYYSGKPDYRVRSATQPTRRKPTDPVFYQFQYTLHTQLLSKSFLENILISKASRNEDRFYGILPFTPYQDRILEVSHWKINTMTSVKLKLYEIMRIEDKIELLFLSSDGEATYSDVLPTFATSTLASTSERGLRLHRTYDPFVNFDMCHRSTIMLYQHEQTNNNSKNNDDEDDDDDDDENVGDGGGSHQYYLRLKPKKEYIVAVHDEYIDSKIDKMMHNLPIFKRLGVHDDEASSTLTFDIVSIPFSVLNDAHASNYEMMPDQNQREFLTLIGCFVRNKWILSPESVVNVEEGHHVMCNDDDKNNPDTFFDIY